ncbi:hypothetical protein J8J14_08095 [Roseomonas sp. SSH11]|uniref:Uncharacterized protein n=1 Tax=Pararoseomonas baculiformis TaxID=2820812 RepID=A0ABS4ADZ4_9PROT|nr:hypothetical protein [Pararoseomonas baculiformis]MBP0444743.1 hypothetical protein [Pararoseomonas baculiformis]
MKAHRFKIGENIELLAGHMTPNDALGQSYTVVRLLPNDAPDREYRIRNDRGGQERVVRESQMRLGSFAALGRNMPLPG